jgi:hypothetical protein
VANLFNDDDGLVDVPLELSLEDWGRVALLAHSQNLTINETITILLEEAVKKAEEIVDAASSSDVSNKKKRVVSSLFTLLRTSPLPMVVTLLVKTLRQA